jgi:outer membrane lipoprotein-sorting protein
MNRMFRIIATILVLAAAFVWNAPAQAGGDLLTRMTALNPHLKTYQAAIHADVHMTSFPYLNPVLDGTYYHKDPSLDKIVFTSGLPGIAKQFGKIYPRIENARDWNRVYIVTQGGDDGKITVFKLVPRKHGRVDHVDVSVDDATATTISMRWNYNDGSGYAELHQEFKQVDGNYLVVRQTGHVEQSIYKADIDSTFGGYKLNPTLSDGFFTQN